MSARFPTVLKQRSDRTTFEVLLDIGSLAAGATLIGIVAIHCARFAGLPL